MGGCSRICRKIHFAPQRGTYWGSQKAHKHRGCFCAFLWHKLAFPMSSSPHPVGQRLPTQLYLQPARQTLVDRPVLLEQLREGLRGKLTLVSAPAGFGKTSLVAAWRKDCETPLAWVSLDEED